MKTCFGRKSEIREIARLNKGRQAFRKRKATYLPIKSDSLAMP
jgi:hypothetical protein